MEPMEIELLLVLKNLAQDVRHFLLRQKNEADKCIADFDKTHDKQKLCHKLTVILCELNASSLQHARAIKKRIKDFGEEDEFDTTIKKLEDLVSESKNETNREETVTPITNKQSDEVQHSHEINHEENPIPIANKEQLSQSSSVDLGEKLGEKLSQASTVEYSIESDGQEMLDNLPKETNIQDTTTTPNCDPNESYNPDRNMSMCVSENDFDVEDLISYDHISQGSSTEENNSIVGDINLDATTIEVSSANQEKAPSDDVNVEVTKELSDVAIDQEKSSSFSDNRDKALSSGADPDTTTKVSDDRDKAKSGADSVDPDTSTKVSDDRDKAKSGKDVDTNPQVSSVSDDQDKAKSGEDVDAGPQVSVEQRKTKLSSGADETDSDADFDASTDVVSDTTDPDKLPSLPAGESDTDAAKKLANVESEDQGLLEEKLRQEAVNNDGDISASDSSNEAQGQSKKRQKISNKAKMAIFKVISEFVRKKREEGKKSNSNSDTKEQDSNSGDKTLTKKKRKRRKKTDQKASTSKDAIQMNSSSSDIDNKTSPVPDNKETQSEKTRLEDTDSDKTEVSDSEVVSPIKKKPIKPLPLTSSDSEGIFIQKKAAAMPLPSSNTEESDAIVPIPSMDIEDTESVRGTKRLLSSPDDSCSEPPKKISADKDDEVDPDDLTQILERHSKTPDDEDGDSITPSDDTASNKKRKISESSAQSYEFNLDDSFVELANSPDNNKSPEEESRPEEFVAEVPSSEVPSGLSSEGRNDLLNLLNDKEQEENALQLLDLLDQEIKVAEVEESSDNDNEDDRLLCADDVPNPSPEVASPANMFSLDDAERDELLNLLNEKCQEYEIEEGDRQRTDSNGVNRDFLLEILNEYVQNISNGQDSDIELTRMNFDAMEIEGISKPDLDSGSDSNSVFLDVVMEELAEQDCKKPTDDEETDDDPVWDAFHKLTKSEDDYLSSSSSSSPTDIDIDDLEIDFSDQEEKEKINRLKQDFGIDKELHIKVEKMDISDFKMLKKTAKKMDEDDSCPEDSTEIERLCNISNLAKKKTKPNAVRFARYHTVSRSSSSCRSKSNDSGSESNDSLSVRYDSDTYLSDNDVPLLDDDQSNDERFHTDLIDNIINSSDNEQSRNDSDDEYDSSDEEKTKKKVLTKKIKKKKDANSSGSEKDEAKTDTEVKDLDSSDEEDFVGVRKSRRLWRNDPLLESDSDTDDPDSKKKNKKKRININWDDSGQKTPNEDSEDDCKVLEKTPSKPIVVTDDESSNKKNTGRRNIKPLMEDNALAISTQVANSEERARIKRLEERDKVKELYSITNNTCNIEEEDPLILDAYKNEEVRIHPKITATLKAHQRLGIQFMWDSCYESIKQLEKGWGGSGCILAHCMGLGKTLQALALIQTLFNSDVTKTKHVLVVCPLSTVSNWKNEFKLAYKNIRNPNVKLFTIQNDGVRRFRIVQNWYKSGGLLVLGYECFSILIDEKKWLKWSKQGLGNKDDIFKALVDPGPDLIICDEGHLLRNKQTQRTMALNKVKTRRRIVLTGTPLQNNLLEYYYMVHFVKPNLLGTEKEFKTNFVNPISNGQFEDSTAEDIMFMKKRTHVLHKILNKTVQRVEDSELKQYLPNFTDQAVFVKLSDLQVNLYNAYLDMVNSRPVVITKAGDISRANFLGDIQILRYICQHPDVVTIAEKTSRLKIKEQDVIDDMDYIEVKEFARNGWYKDLLPKEGTKKLEMGSKMMTVVNLVKEAAEVGDKVLIFAQAYAEMENLEWFLCNHLEFKKGHDYYRMDGTIKAERRADMCNSFNSNENALKVFIMSTKVGGLGLNLTAANRVILMNVNWNPSYDIQSVFRVFRFGQTKPVYVYRLIAMDTMEEKMYQRQVTKLAIAHRVVDKHQITRHYSAADIQEFYSVRPTITGARPVPNVPEDRVLAKLLQKHKFIHRWHEHQALLANRPEEDLDELQKNAAWEEFNRKPDPPPQFPVMGDHPNFRTATAVLAGQSGIRPLGPQHPGPSGLLLRPLGTASFHARPPGQYYGSPGIRPTQYPGASGQFPETSSGPRPGNTGSWTGQWSRQPGQSGMQPVPQPRISGTPQGVQPRMSGPPQGVQPRPLGVPPAVSVPQPGPSGFNRSSFVAANQKLNAVRQNLNNTHFPDHSYSLPKANLSKQSTQQQSSGLKIPASKPPVMNLTKPAILPSQQSPKIINAGNNSQNVRPIVVGSQQLPSSSIKNSDNIVVSQPLSKKNNSGNIVQNVKANVATKTTVINFGKVVPNSRPTAVSNQNVSVGNGVTLSLEKSTKAPTIQPSTANKPNLTKKRDREPEKPKPNGNAHLAKRPKLDSSNSNNNSTINLSLLSPTKAGDSLEQKIANAINEVKKTNGKNTKNAKNATLSQANQINNNNSLVQNVNTKSLKDKIQTNKTPGKNKSANERTQNTIRQRLENGHQSNRTKNILQATPFRKLPPGTKPPSSAKIISVTPSKVFGVQSPVVLDNGIDLTSPPPSVGQQQSPQMREQVRSSLDHLRKLQQLGKSKSSTDLKQDPKVIQIKPKILNFRQNPIGSPTFTRIMGSMQGTPGSPSTLNAAKNLTFAHVPQIAAVAAPTSSGQSPKSRNVRPPNATPPRAVPVPSKMNVNGIPVTVTYGSPKVGQSGLQRQEQPSIQQAPMRLAQGQFTANTLQRKMTNDVNKIIRISTKTGSPSISSQPSNTTKVNHQSNKKLVAETVSATSLPILNQLPPSTPIGFKSNKENRTKRKSLSKSNNNAEENQSSGSSSQEQLFSDLKRKGFNISPVKNHNPIKKDAIKKD